MEEPSVLDYLLEKITFWKEGTIEIPQPEKAPPPPEGEAKEGEGKPSPLSRHWLVPLPIFLALTAQFLLEPPRRLQWVGLALYLIAGILLSLLIWKKRWQLPEAPPSGGGNSDVGGRVRTIPLLAGSIFSAAAFILFGGNRFNTLNVSLWLLGMGFISWSFWRGEGWWDGLKGQWHEMRHTGVRITPWAALLLAAFGVAAFFRFDLLRQVPPEMFSDHAEKLLDVADVLHGQLRIFFPRNTGREAFQMYLTAAMSKIFGTGLSFLSLKLGTTLAGFFTLPYIYLLGKEYAHRRVGLFAVLLAGIAYWPNVISRVALRFTLYPFFAAPVVYYFFRGMRRQRRVDFIYAGIALGLGLHGYSPFRIMPLIVLALALMYYLHHRSEMGVRRTVAAVLIIGLISLIVFLPLFRYALSHYWDFSYRMRTRMTDLEHPLPGAGWKIFLTNMVQALIMFQWDNGGIWVHSIPGRPALGVVAGALFTLGLVIVLARYVRYRGWQDLAMVTLIPLFVLTSALSIAFPIENPSLNRTGGAIIPVFILAGVALDGLFVNLKNRLQGPRGRRLAVGLVVSLLLISATQNRALVFEEYYHQFHVNAWNTSEIGAVIDKFNETIGEEDHAWVVPYPHWVDTRLVGIQAERPLKDYGLRKEDIPFTEDIPGPKLYIVKPEDEAALQDLRALYPDGYQREYLSDVPGRNFIMYFVVPRGKAQQ